MYEEHTAQLKDGTLEITAVLAPDFAEAAHKFCKDITGLDVKKSWVKITLDVAKATAKIELRIAPLKPAKPPIIAAPPVPSIEPLPGSIKPDPDTEKLEAGPLTIVLGDAVDAPQPLPAASKAAKPVARKK